MKIIYSTLIAAFTLTSSFAQTAKTNEVLPSKVLNLTNWKLTLPIPSITKSGPQEVRQPELSTLNDPEHFLVNKTGDAVVFRARVDGTTTVGSNFPRSELREMTDEGKKNAAWSSSQGTHTMFIDQQITHLPDLRRQIVCGQIHDADKYLLFFRLEDDQLLISVNGGNRDVLDPHYVLGTRFNVKMVVKGDKTEIYYNGKLMYTYNTVFSGAYFKAGAYVQSSCKGEKKTAGELCSAYGEVEIFNVWVKHE